MRGITKRFGRIVANDGIDLEIAAGEIHALLGENGAGKSTLVKILYGLVSKDSGSIGIRGRNVDIASPAAAISLGIGMVHQHFMLIDQMTVTENLIAGIEPTRRGLLDLGAAKVRVRTVAETYGLGIDPDARVGDLSVGEQQRVEILKSFMREADILILDEPTAVLTPPEVDELFAVLQRLKSRGKSILFITHKLRETLEFTDKVTILRQGRRVATLDTPATSASELARLMVGRELARPLNERARPSGGVALRVESLVYVDSAGRRRLDGVDLSVHAGEIVGIAGVEGNGQRELEEVVTGVVRPSSGRVVINGCQLRGGPKHFRQLGGAHIPSDRLRRGLVSGYSLWRNALLGRQWRPPFVRRGWVQSAPLIEHTSEILTLHQVKAASVQTPAATLSGGNQQRFVIGRELALDPAIIVAAQPTRGVDIGAVQSVHKWLDDMRRRGKGVLLISADLDELYALSDRIAVLYGGRIVGMRPTDDLPKELAGLWMAGMEADEQYPEQCADGSTNRCDDRA